MTITATESPSGPATGTSGTFDVLPVAFNDSAARFSTLGAKVQVLANDRGSGLTVDTFDATSASGGTVTLNSGWLFYEPPLSDPAS